MKKNASRIFIHIDYALEPVLIIPLLLAALLQVLYRFVPFVNVPWTLELITFLYSASVWVGISIAIRENSHIGIEAIYRRFPYRVKKIARLFSWLAFATTMIFFGYLGSIAISGYFRSGSVTPAMQVPYWLVRSPIILGALLSLYRITEKVVAIISGNDPEFAVSTGTEREAGYESAEKLW